MTELLDTPHGLVSDVQVGALIQVLRNIAHGYHNAGRRQNEQMTEAEYAKDALVSLRLWND